MYSVLLTIHVLITIALIITVLMQRNASDGIGMSSSSSNSFLSGRAAASAVTRTTAILATLFILTSLGLGILTTHTHPGVTSIMDRPVTSAPASASSKTDPATPVKPSIPRPE